MTQGAKKVGIFSFIFKIFKLQKRNVGLVAIMFLCITTMVAFELFFPLAMKLLVDSALVAKDIPQVILIISIFGIGYIIMLAANLIEIRTTSLLSVKLSSQFRLKIMNGLLRATPIDESYDNKILIYLTEDVRHLEGSIGAVWRTIKFSMTLMYGSVLLAVFDFRLFLLTAVLLPFTLLAPRYYGSKLPQGTEIWRESQAQILASAKETRSMHNVIHVLRQRVAWLFQFKTIARTAAKASKQHQIHQTMVGRSGYFSIEFVKLLLLTIGVYFVLTDILTIGELVGFLALFAILSNSLAGIFGYQSTLIRGNGALNTIQSFFDQIQPRARKTVHRIEPLQDAITFDNVGLEIDNTQILQDINLRIQKGHSVAFVGPSGAGKSTALKLLLLQLQASTGKIYFDKHLLNEIDESQYFPKIGVVFQEPKLFVGTIRENILVANKTASEEALVEATKKAEIYDEIMSFKEGFDTFIRSGSSNLSGGQKQRVAIARAFINNPELIFLDEASSALDPFTDAAIEETISQLQGNHTIISVTHHLKTIKNFDEIVVFKKGHIEETGTHQQLLENNGLYAQLWNKQNGIDINRENETFSLKPDWLRFVPIFQSLDDKTLLNISRELVMERFETNQTIFSEGDSGSKMYIVASGIVEISVPESEDSDNHKILAKFTTGDFFGEIAILFNEPRTARATTKSVCLLLSLSAKQFDKILQSLPEDVKKDILTIANERRKNNPFVNKI